MADDDAVLADAPAFELRGVTAGYGGRVVLRDVTVTCEGGEILGVVGPNGAGKSTLLKVLAGLHAPDSGTVLVLGGRPAHRHRQLAYLAQRSEAEWDYPAVVRDVVAMGRLPYLGRLGRRGPHDRERVDEALGRLGLADLAERPIAELSGGQRQRTLLARAFAQEAAVLLLDEPFAAVDAVTERLLWHELGRARDEGQTVVVVNHDLAIAAERFDRLVLLSGRVVADGPPGEALRPERVLEAYGALPGALRAGLGEGRTRS